MNLNPKISIVITTFNRLEQLKRAYSSVLNQSYSNIEIIIVDDCSSDGTIDFLQSIRENNVNVILNKIKRGVQFNRNIGTKASKGDFVVGLDDDDYFHENRIEYMVDNFDPKYSFIGTLLQPINTTKRIKCNEILELEDILYHNDGFHWPLVLRQRLIDVGLFDLNLTALQDHDMWVRLIHKYGPARILQKPYYFLDTSGDDRITKNYEKKNQGIEAFINKHKSLMTKTQLNYQNFYLRRMKKSNISPWFFVRNVPVRFWKKNYKYLLYPIIEKLRNY